MLNLYLVSATSDGESLDEFIVAETPVQAGRLLQDSGMGDDETPYKVYLIMPNLTGPIAAGGARELGWYKEIQLVMEKGEVS